MKKIIISSIVIGLILIIGITTIVLAVVPTGLNYTIEKPNQIIIVSAKTDYSSSSITENNFLTLRDREVDEANEISNIYSVFCHSFEQKILNAIFNGELNKSIEENYVSKGNESVKNNSKETNKMTLIFKYDTKQKFKNYNHEYNYLFFELSNVNERVEVKFGATNSSSLSANSSSFSYNYYYKGKANFFNLYNFVNNL